MVSKSTNEEIATRVLGHAIEEANVLNRNAVTTDFQNSLVRRRKKVAKHRGSSTAKSYIADIDCNLIRQVNIPATKCQRAAIWGKRQHPVQRDFVGNARTLGGGTVGIDFFGCRRPRA